MAFFKSKDESAPNGEGEKPILQPRPSVSDVIAGEARDFNANLLPYLPQDLIGGSIPHIPGTEDDAVWNAASQACGTEKIHYAYAIDENRIWYLACPSSSLASNPDSWCPLAAALPGNDEHWDRETVYLYEQEGLASALRWDPETGRMQVYLGASRTILPRIQSMDANFVTINPETAKVEPWQNKKLRTEKLSRAVTRMLILSGLAVNFVIAMILVVNLISLNFVQRDMEIVKQETSKASLKLMEDASNVMQSDTIRHMVRVQNLLDKLAISNGYLVRYEVNGNTAEWEASVPLGLVSSAIKNTTIVSFVGNRPRTFVPVTGETDGGSVRIIGKR